MERCLAGTQFPDGSLVASHEDGCTEPWVAQLVSALLVASGAKTVLETGGFRGTTSAWLALALASMGGGDLIVCEIDKERAGAISLRLRDLPIRDVYGDVRCADVLEVIASLENEALDFVWLDDDHSWPHVQAEILALWPKMKSGGLIVLHDVFGSTDLKKIVKQYHGYSIDLPRLGPAGGIGIIQVDRDG